MYVYTLLTRLFLLYFCVQSHVVYTYTRCYKITISLTLTKKNHSVFFISIFGSIWLESRRNVDSAAINQIVVFGYMYCRSLVEGDAAAVGWCWGQSTSASLCRSTWCSPVRDSQLSRPLLAALSSTWYTAARCTCSTTIPCYLLSNLPIV